MTLTIRTGDGFSVNGAAKGMLLAYEDGEPIGWEESANWSNGNAKDRAAVRLAKIAGIGADDADRLIAKTIAAARKQAEEAQSDSGKDEVEGEERYVATSEGIVYVKIDGSRQTLTNFTAKIVEEVVQDDGVETRRLFQIQGKVGEISRTFNVPAKDFAGLGWVPVELGARAIVSPGQSVKDRARAAIQELSGEVHVAHVYVHTGWTSIGDDRIYLHGAGAIGANGVVHGIDVRLDGPLARFRLPAPSTDKDEVRQAVRASLAMVEVAPDAITFPLLGQVYRTPLGAMDSSVHLVGHTGTGKSELAALAQQHYGAELDSRKLPASWASTANSLEAMAFRAKEALLVVDDFCPQGSAYDVQRLHGTADRLFRAQGNSSGRGRMTADAKIANVQYPRGSILSTGEDVPRGQSLRARLLVEEVGQNDVIWQRLTEAQRDARQGLYAQSMASYIKWTASLPNPSNWLRDEHERLRTNLLGDGQHKRTPSIMADLFLGIGYFLRFAESVKALTSSEVSAFQERAQRALLGAGEEQRRHQRDADPAQRFISLIASAIASQAAHVATVYGAVPGSAHNPATWGWTLHTTGESSEWRSHGQRIGWIDGTDDLYIDDDATLAVVQRLAGNDGIAIGISTLRKRLYEAGMLASVEHDGDKVHYEIKKTIQGARMRVLHLRISQVLPAREPTGEEL